jgi:site-specific DNA recombinase
MKQTRAAVYARVSTEEQAKTGYSLPDQIATGRAFLLRQGHTDIVEYVDEGFSGEFIDRPGLTNLRDDIAAGRINAVVIYDPDRLARKLSIQLLVAEEMEKAKVSLHFITGDFDASPEGRLFFSMRGAIAEFEKAKILDRTIRGKRKKSSQGKIIQDFGLYGYNYVPETCSYVINEEQAAVIRLIFNFVLDEKLSLNYIQRELKQRVILSPKGRPLWPSSSLYNLLTNRTYTGTFHSMKNRQNKSGIKTRTTTKRPSDEWISIPVPVIVDEVTFERVQRQLKSNKAATKRPIVHPFLFGGIIYCGICGRRMLAHHSVFKEGVYKSYYVCATQRYYNLRNMDIKCPSRSLPADALDADLWAKLVAVFKNPEKAKQYTPKQTPIPDNQGEIERLNKMETELIKRRETIAKWFRQQKLSEKEADEELNQIRAQISDIEDRKKSLNPQPTSSLIPKLSFEELAAKLRPLIERGDLTPDEKKLIIRASLARVEAIRIDKLVRGCKKPPVFKVTWEPV